MSIVEYSTEKTSMNAYPVKIISPPLPSQCCPSSSDQVGGIQEEKGWPFVYTRCMVCGFTMRRFAPREELLETRRIWRNSAQMFPTSDVASGEKTASTLRGKL